MSAAATRRPPPIGPPKPPPETLLSVPGFKPLFLSSWLWHTTRWGGLFACSYLVTQLADAPILNQLVGTAIFAPMLVGGLAAGAISDRFDRRRIIQATQFVLIPLSILMFVLVQSGAVRVWMVFPFMLAIGVGGLVNMTAQRPLIYDNAGPRFGTRALSMETVGAASSSVAGTFLGGALIEAVGIGAAFGLLAVALCLSAVLLHLVTVPSPRPAVKQQPPMRAQMGRSFALLRDSPPLLSMLGITVAMNLFYFSFVPLVPVMAQRFGSNALLTGILAGAAGCGQLVSGLYLASRHVRRQGHVYVVGSFTAVAMLGVFTAAPVFLLGFVALFVAGAGQGGFGSMQAVLAIEAAGPDQRGAALGLLSTAIGALPIGMALVGVVAQAVGATAAVTASSVTGLAAMALWLWRRPEVLGEPVEHVEWVDGNEVLDVLDGIQP